MPHEAVCQDGRWWSYQDFLGATAAAPLVDRRVYIRLPVGGEVQVGPSSTGAGALAQARGWSANSPPPPLRRPRAANETRALAIELRTGQIAPDEMRRIRALHAHRAWGAFERSADGACRTHRSSSARSFGSSGGFTQSMAGAPRRAWAAVDEPKSFFDPAALSKSAAPPLMAREPDAPPRVQLPDGSGWWYYEGEGSGEASWQPLDDDTFSDSVQDKDAWSPETASFHGVSPPARMRMPAPTRFPPSSDENAPELRAPTRIPPSSDENASELRAPMRISSSPIRRPGTMREDELRALRRARAQETRRRNARARNAAQAALHDR